MGPEVLDFQIEELWKYSALRTWVIKEEGILIILQAAVATKGMFSMDKSLMPNPPLCIGLQISSQTLKEIGLDSLSLWIPAHLTFLTIEVGLDMVPSFKRIVDM